MRGALRGRDDLRFLWESRFDSGLLRQDFLILELGPQGLKVQSVVLLKGSHSEIA